MFSRIKNSSSTSWRLYRRRDLTDRVYENYPGRCICERALLRSSSTMNLSFPSASIYMNVLKLWQVAKLLRKLGLLFTRVSIFLLISKSEIKSWFLSVNEISHFGDIAGEFSEIFQRVLNIALNDFFIFLRKRMSFFFKYALISWYQESIALSTNRPQVCVYECTMDVCVLVQLD
jgi:hypothetical protein